MLNDSDTLITKEFGMRTYLRQMRATAKLPDLCMERIKLVRHMLTDIQATAYLDAAWDKELFPKQEAQDSQFGRI
jgi:hypothetical protein